MEKENTSDKWDTSSIVMSKYFDRDSFSSMREFKTPNDTDSVLHDSWVNFETYNYRSLSPRTFREDLRNFYANHQNQDIGNEIFQQSSESIFENTNIFDEEPQPTLFQIVSGPLDYDFDAFKNRLFDQNLEENVLKSVITSIDHDIIKCDEKELALGNSLRTILTEKKQSFESKLLDLEMGKRFQNVTISTPTMNFRQQNLFSSTPTTKKQEDCETKQNNLSTPKINITNIDTPTFNSTAQLSTMVTLDDFSISTTVNGSVEKSAYDSNTIDLSKNQIIVINSESYSSFKKSTNNCSVIEISSDSSFTDFSSKEDTKIEIVDSSKSFENNGGVNEEDSMNKASGQGSCELEEISMDNSFEDDQLEEIKNLIKNHNLSIEFLKDLILGQVKQKQNVKRITQRLTQIFDRQRVLDESHEVCESDDVANLEEEHPLEKTFVKTISSCENELSKFESTLKSINLTCDEKLVFEKSSSCELIKVTQKLKDISSNLGKSQKSNSKTSNGKFTQNHFLQKNKSLSPTTIAQQSTSAQKIKPKIATNILQISSSVSKSPNFLCVTEKSLDSNVLKNSFLITSGAKHSASKSTPLVKTTTKSSCENEMSKIEYNLKSINLTNDEKLTPLKSPNCDLFEETSKIKDISSKFEANTSKVSSSALQNAHFGISQDSNELKSSFCELNTHVGKNTPKSTPPAKTTPKSSKTRNESSQFEINLKSIILASDQKSPGENQSPINLANDQKSSKEIESPKFETSLKSISLASNEKFTLLKSPNCELFEETLKTKDISLNFEANISKVSKSSSVLQNAPFGISKDSNKLKNSLHELNTTSIGKHSAKLTPLAKATSIFPKENDSPTFETNLKYINLDLGNDQKSTPFEKSSSCELFKVTPKLQDISSNFEKLTLNISKSSNALQNAIGILHDSNEFEISFRELNTTNTTPNTSKAENESSKLETNLKFKNDQKFLKQNDSPKFESTFKSLNMSSDQKSSKEMKENESPIKNNQNSLKEIESPKFETSLKSINLANEQKSTQLKSPSCELFKVTSKRENESPKFGTSLKSINVVSEQKSSEENDSLKFESSLRSINLPIDQESPGEIASPKFETSIKLINLANDQKSTLLNSQNCEPFKVTLNLKDIPSNFEKTQKSNSKSSNGKFVSAQQKSTNLQKYKNLSPTTNAQQSTCSQKTTPRITNFSSVAKSPNATQKSQVSNKPKSLFRELNATSIGKHSPKPPSALAKITPKFLSETKSRKFEPRSTNLTSAEKSTPSMKSVSCDKTTPKLIAPGKTQISNSKSLKIPTSAQNKLKYTKNLSSTTKAQQSTSAQKIPQSTSGQKIISKLATNTLQNSKSLNALNATENLPQKLTSGAQQTNLGGSNKKTTPASKLLPSSTLTKPKVSSTDSKKKVASKLLLPNTFGFKNAQQSLPKPAAQRNELHPPISQKTGAKKGLIFLKNEKEISKPTINKETMQPVVVQQCLQDKAVETPLKCRENVQGTNFETVPPNDLGDVLLKNTNEKILMQFKELFNNSPNEKNFLKMPQSIGKFKATKIQEPKIHSAKKFACVASPIGVYINKKPAIVFEKTLEPKSLFSKIENAQDGVEGKENQKSNEEAKFKYFDENSLNKRAPIKKIFSGFGRYYEKGQNTQPVVLKQIEIREVPDYVKTVDKMPEITVLQHLKRIPGEDKKKVQRSESIINKDESLFRDPNAQVRQSDDISLTIETKYM